MYQSFFVSLSLESETLDQVPGHYDEGRHTGIRSSTGKDLDRGVDTLIIYKKKTTEGTFRGLDPYNYHGVRS